MCWYLQNENLPSSFLRTSLKDCWGKPPHIAIPRLSLGYKFCKPYMVIKLLAKGTMELPGRGQISIVAQNTDCPTALQTQNRSTDSWSARGSVMTKPTCSLYWLYKKNPARSVQGTGETEEPGTGPICFPSVPRKKAVPKPSRPKTCTQTSGLPGALSLLNSQAHRLTSTQEGQSPVTDIKIN